MAVQTSPLVDATAIRDEVARILSDAAFVRSPRMQRFLSFVVEEALAGRADQLSEYGIGLEVFDRGRPEPRVWIREPFFSEDSPDLSDHRIFAGDVSLTQNSKKTQSCASFPDREHSTDADTP